jgi:hypothetical protein
VRNVSIIFLTVAAVSAGVLRAQELAPPIAPVAPVAAEPRLLADAPATGPARGWKRDDGASLDGAATAHGPATRVAPATDVSLSKSEFTLTGSFGIRATFQRFSQSSASAPYGLTLGTTDQRGAVMLFLVRPDGAWSIQRSGRSPMWTPSSETERATIDRLEVRVQGRTVEFWVNGSRVTSVEAASGELDGQPGVHVGGQGDVMVSMFTVSGPRELFVK